MVWVPPYFLTNLSLLSPGLALDAHLFHPYPSPSILFPPSFNVTSLSLLLPHPCHFLALVTSKIFFPLLAKIIPLPRLGELIPCYILVTPFASLLLFVSSLRRFCSQIRSC